MPKTNKLDPVTLDFFDTAPLRVQCTIVAKCSPEVLFETLRGDAVWTEWAGVIQKVVWTSDEPIARNSTRDVVLVGGMLVKEVAVRSPAQLTPRAWSPQNCLRSAFLSGLPSADSGIEVTKSIDLGDCTAPFASFTAALSSAASSSLPS